MATAGCETGVKDKVEQSFSEVSVVVGGFCSPPEEPETKVVCPKMGDELKCDLKQALFCAQPLNDVLDRSPDWKKICPYVHFSTFKFLGLSINLHI